MEFRNWLHQLIQGRGKDDGSLACPNVQMSADQVSAGKDVIPEKATRGKDKSASSILPAIGDYKVGDLIGNQYEIRRILGGEGESGMGVVYACYDPQNEMVLALKTFQDRFLSSKGKKDMFKKEALAWTLLERHPYIVQAYWVQELGYRLFVANEFIAPDEEERNTLEHYLQGPISIKQALTWAIQFCHGMEHAYSKGVTPHRDIKPQNLMITVDGTLKITDFGIAGIWEGVGEAQINPESFSGNQKGFTFLKGSGGKVIAGTPPYMAPEQFDGKADARSDIYAFGVVLYRMFARSAFPFYPETNQGWEKAHRFSPVPSLEKDHPAGAYLNTIIQRCLEKTPGKRYQDFSSFRQGVEKCYLELVTKVTGDDVPALPRGIELNADELVNKGLSLHNLGLHDQAIEAYREALRITPDYSAAHNNLGGALRDKGLVDEAIAEYREALWINPDDATVHYNLGVVLQGKGLIDEAMAEYREALRINPDNTTAHYNLGGILQGKGLIDEAIAEYREAVRITPDLAAAYTNLGALLADKGLLEETIKAFENFILYAPPEYSEHVAQAKEYIRELRHRIS